MRRRTLLAATGTAGAAAVAGCGAFRTSETLSDPTVGGEGPRRYLLFETGGSELASFGFDAEFSGGIYRVDTELSHRDGTTVKSIELRVRMPTLEGNTPAEVAVVSPVEGDSSAPPELHLHSPDRRPGTLITVEDLDDLADETISTLSMVVTPPSSDPSTGIHPVAVDATVELAGGGTFGTDYTLDGGLELRFPNY
jgi:hypothetical protein